ncbi:MAG: hypothetical protein ACREXK_02015 [Gammaproteobacteria bacterium]
MPHEDREQIELARRQRHFFSIRCDQPAARETELPSRKTHRGIRLARLRPRGATGAPEHAAHPRQQLPEIEGLR